MTRNRSANALWRAKRSCLTVGYKRTSTNFVRLYNAFIARYIPS